MPVVAIAWEMCNGYPKELHDGCLDLSRWMSSTLVIYSQILTYKNRSHYPIEDIMQIYPIEHMMQMWFC